MSDAAADDVYLAEEVLCASAVVSKQRVYVQRAAPPPLEAALNCRLLLAVPR